jgi:hypothetical protein
MVFEDFGFNAGAVLLGKDLYKIFTALFLKNLFKLAWRRWRTDQSGSVIFISGDCTGQGDSEVRLRSLQDMVILAHCRRSLMLSSRDSFVET